MKRRFCNYYNAGKHWITLCFLEQFQKRIRQIQNHSGDGLSGWKAEAKYYLIIYFICTASDMPQISKIFFKRQTTDNFIDQSANTFITVLTGFYLLVILVNISVSKSLSTELALVRFIFTVYHFVGTHLVKPLERFITNLTIIGSFFC